MIFVVKKLNNGEDANLLHKRMIQYKRSEPIWGLLYQHVMKHDESVTHGPGLIV